MTRIPPLGIALAIALALTACTRLPLIDTTSVETRQATIDEALALLQPKDQERFRDAIAKIDAGLPIPGTKEVLDWSRFDHPTVSEILHVTEGMTRAPVETIVEPDWPNPANAAALLSSYKLEAALLEERRRASLEAGRQLVDQFPIADFGFAPPRRSGQLDQQEAKFRFAVTNQTRFDAYSPAVRVSIFVPDDETPIFVRSFRPKDEDEPIGPGSTITFDAACCGVIADPYHFDLLSNLPLGSRITAEIEDVVDNAKKSLIDKQAFSVNDEKRRDFLTHCIAHLEADVSAWRPPADGAPCLPAEELANRMEKAEQDALRARLTPGLASR